MDRGQSPLPQVRVVLWLDTALVEFTENEIAETREISENFYVDLDRQRNPVSMTIEHARTNARLQEFWYQEVPRPPQEESRSS